MSTPKTYLQLVQDTFAECQFAGTAPVSVAGNIGAVADIVRWVRDGYREIQQRCPAWRWMRKKFALRTVVGNSNYAYSVAKEDVFNTFDDNDEITEFSHWHIQDRYNPVRIYREADGVAGETRMGFTTWDIFRAAYSVGALQTQTGFPTVVTIDNADRLVLWPIPDAAYIVRGEYQRSPQVLQSDGSTPDMPAQFHELITYHAMSRYATNAVAPEVLARAREEGGRMMRALEFNQMPQMRLGGAMV